MSTTYPPLRITYDQKSYNLCPGIHQGPAPGNPSQATLAVYSILGAKVTTLTSGIQPPGTHTHIWDAAEYSSGVYIIRLETPQLTSSQRITVVK
ncbi:hypothetical protein CEE37_09485 [candidate division LCP-89 bacterium B3_LCP]|uniref:Secretion system C-terminal sorting domain-containing protein n=1 Tax=candidate division LCP-89 bacterium B3_LCP TaxID=2012998 RepID=A0A532UYZ4_UNCL8|nr:MAG: hypothetical protein CEE37_09485 [candidate division LCP-89 bacterium B3_LCP]